VQRRSPAFPFDRKKNAHRDYEPFIFICCQEGGLGPVTYARSQPRRGQAPRMLRLAHSRSRTTVWRTSLLRYNPLARPNAFSFQAVKIAYQLTSFGARSIPFWTGANARSGGDQSFDIKNCRPGCVPVGRMGGAPCCDRIARGSGDVYSNATDGIRPAGRQPIGTALHGSASCLGPRHPLYDH